VHQALRFKLIFFVLVDGWSLVAKSLVQSWAGCGRWQLSLHRHCEPTGRANARPMMTGSVKRSS
jgi:hypothetical protein